MNPKQCSVAISLKWLMALKVLRDPTSGSVDCFLLAQLNLSHFFESTFRSEEGRRSCWPGVACECEVLERSAWSHYVSVISKPIQMKCGVCIIHVERWVCIISELEMPARATYSSFLFFDMQVISQNPWVCGLCPLAGILNNYKTTFLELDLFPSWGEGKETPTVLGPFGRVVLNYWF
jgi:hypothetical protein